MTGLPKFSILSSGSNFLYFKSWLVYKPCTFKDFETQVHAPTVIASAIFTPERIVHLAPI